MRGGQTSLWITTLILLATSTVAAQKVNWLSDVDEAKKLAAEQNKLVMLHFSAEWCRPCKHLETFVFSSDMVAKAIHGKLIPVHIDTDSNPELVEQFAIKEIPSDVILSPKGRVISKRQSPKNSSNYIRMVKNIPINEATIVKNNVEITQKINEVLQAGNQNVALSGGDFQAQRALAPSEQEISDEAKELLKRSKTAESMVGNSMIKPVIAETKIVTDNDSGMLSPNASSAKRVINDNFFVEKSKQEVNGTTNGPAIGETTIRNPYSELNESAFVPQDQSENSFLPPASVGAAEKTGASAEKPIETLDPQMMDDKFMAPTDSKSEVATMDDVSAGANVDEVSATEELLDSDFMLNGFCPVALLRDGKWLKGDREFGCEHRGRIYLFASEGNLNSFQEDPDNLTPILAGYDPVLYHEKGELVDGRQEHGVFVVKLQKRKIVLFSSADTRQRFQESPEKFMSTVQTAMKMADQSIRWLGEFT